MKDYYQILGITNTATPVEIKARFRYLALAFHPDKFSSDEHKAFAATDFRQVKEAYDTLSDPLLRTEYDRQLANEALPKTPLSDADFIVKGNPTQLAQLISDVHFDFDVRQRACRALANCGLQAIPYLVELLRTPKLGEEIYEQLCTELRYFGPDAAPAVLVLINMITSGTYAERRAAVETLGQIGAASAPAVSALMPIANLGDSDAIYALVEIGAPALEPLKKLLQPSFWQWLFRITETRQQLARRRLIESAIREIERRSQRFAHG